MLHKLYLNIIYKIKKPLSKIKIESGFLFVRFMILFLCLVYYVDFKFLAY